MLPDLITHDDDSAHMVLCPMTSTTSKRLSLQTPQQHPGPGPEASLLLPLPASMKRAAWLTLSPR